MTVIDLNERAGNRLVEESGGAIAIVPADATNPNDVNTAIGIAAERRPLRIAVNCAGIAIGERTLDRNGAPAEYVPRGVVEIGGGSFL